MKKLTFTLSSLLFLFAATAQTQSAKPQVGNKIVLSKGQKITAVSEMTAETSLMPGMTMNNKTTSTSTLEVKEISDASFSLTSTTTRLKMDMDMMGQTTNYDSDKKEDQDSEIGKALAGTLNVPDTLTVDIFSGKEINKSKAADKAGADNNASSLTGMFGSTTGGSGMATNAFLVIPANMAIGASWSDSTSDKDMKTVRVYTLKSMDGNSATVGLDETSSGTTELEYQGMQMKMSNTTKTTGDIITDITSGRVSSRTTKSDISGSMQIMGQDMPITASASTTTTYK